jgi:Arc/MetJ-type ribon-helix-helix transcriptional regulator
MRINARLDDEAQQQIDYLVQTTGQSVSHVVRESVARYYQSVRSEQGAGLRHFAKAIGAGDSGRSDTASRYKELLTESLAEKHGLGRTDQDGTAR